jgi:hypothetical protein
VKVLVYKMVADVAVGKSQQAQHGLLLKAGVLGATGQEHVAAKVNIVAAVLDSILKRH